MYRRILKSVREFRTPTVITFLCMVFEAGIECVIPFITARLINGIRTGEELSDVIRTGLILAGMAMVSLFCGWMGGIACARASAGFSRNLRNDLFAKIQSFSFESVDKFSSASLVTRLTTDVGYAGMAYMMVIRTAIRSPLMFIFAVIMAYIMGGALSMTFVIVIPLLVFGLLIIARFAMPAFRRVFRKYDKLNESIEENVRGMRVVKGFSREDYEKEKFGRAAGDIKRDFTHAERIVAINSPLMQSCIYFNLVFILLFGSYIVISSGGAKIDVGQMSAMITYGFQVMMQLMMLVMIFVTLTISAESARRIDEVLREEPTITDPADPITEVTDGSIDFDAVSFKYSAAAHKDALSDVDLHIKSGMTVGILGGTGSGKSTLMYLLERLYTLPEECGTISVGGVDIRKMSMAHLRRNIGMVLQEPYLFSRTLEENIGIREKKYDREKIRSAAKVARIDDTISSFTSGYETFVGERGVTLSGGQKQRTAIAQMLVRDPEIMVFDDSLSAVDAETDARIRHALRERTGRVTTILISHRITTLMQADHIIVLDQGRIAEQGTHEELNAANGIYHRICELQQMREEETPASVIA